MAVKISLVEVTLEDLAETSVFTNEPVPDFEAPDALWLEFEEAREKYEKLLDSVIVRSTPLTAEARKHQELTWKGIRAEDAAYEVNDVDAAVTPPTVDFLQARLKRAEKEMTGLRKYRAAAEAEIARLSALVQKHEDLFALEGIVNDGTVPEEFGFGYAEDIHANELVVFKDERLVRLVARPIVNADRQILRYENTVAYGVFGPSMSRLRAGFRGEGALDTSERVIENATVDDLAAALAWLVSGIVAVKVEGGP